MNILFYHKRLMEIGLLSAIVLFLSIHLTAQTRLDRNVIGSGATRVSNAAHALNGTIGQVMIGPARSSAINGSFGFWYNKSNVTVNVERLLEPAPSSVLLEPNYPNPASFSTTIRFSIHLSMTVTLSLLDVTGRSIHTFGCGLLEAGSYQMTLRTEHLAPGMYFYKLDTDGQSYMKPFTIVK